MRNQPNLSALDSTRLSLRDLIDEAIAAIAAKPGRSALTALGTVLGVGTLVVILGLTTTATGQVSARFDAQAATTVVVSDNRDAGSGDGFPLSENALARAADLNGVVGVGMIYTPATDDGIRSARPDHSAEQPIPIFAVSPGTWKAIGPKFSAGRPFDEFHANLPVVVLGKGAATLLGVSGRNAPTAVEIGGRPFLVAGILADSDRRPELLLGALVPSGTAMNLWGEPTPKEHAQAVIATRPGAALQVANEASTSLSFLHPKNIQVAPPPDARALRDSISADLRGLFYALAAISLLIGAVGIANTTLVAVMERAGEIGVRRALGAKGHHIAAQVLSESAGLGVLGGTVGSSIGLAAVLVVSFSRGWSPIIDPWTLLWAPMVGLVIGVVAGLYPALKAIRIEPTQALRGTG